MMSVSRQKKHSAINIVAVQEVVNIKHPFQMLSYKDKGNNKKQTKGSIRGRSLFTCHVKSANSIWRIKAFLFILSTVFQKLSSFFNLPEISSVNILDTELNQTFRGKCFLNDHAPFVSKIL